MKVYQIVIKDEEGRTYCHDIFWHKAAAEKFRDECYEKSDWMYCSIDVQEKEIRE